jgi:putative tryptophan/tyrosine transport system substrate-binding protein
VCRCGPAWRAVLTRATRLRSTPEPPHHPGMDRRRFLVTSLAAAFAAPLAAEPQQPGRVWRIGILSPTSPSNAQALHDRLRAGLRDLGYVEGQNLIIEYRWAERKNDRLPGLAAELVHLRVDLIVANGTAGAFAAHDATNTIPIVMADASDPVRDGLVASLARPGGNVTGLTIFAPELVGKQLELLKDVVPKFARVAVLSNPDNRTHAFSVMEAEVAARVLRVHVQSVRVRSPDDFRQRVLRPDERTRQRAPFTPGLVP